MILVVLFLAACGISGQPATLSSGNIKIVTTIFPPYDFAREIAKDKADITLLLKPGAESHSFEPTPQDIKTIENADLFIYTGSEMMSGWKTFWPLWAIVRPRPCV